MDKKEKYLFFKFSLIFLSFISYVFSCLIYLLIRPKNVIVFQWMECLGLNSVIDSCRSSISSFNFSFPSWMIYSFPDASWVLFGSILILLNWNFQTSNWLYFFPFLGIGSELLQFFKVIPGTFDKIDIFLLIFASFLPVFILHISNNKKLFTPS